ncbi:acetyltransferase [Pseudomonadota bacterium]
MMHKPFIVVGAGGHAKVVLDLLLEMGEEVLGLTDADPARKGDLVLDVPVIGGDEVLQGFEADAVNLALGIGASGDDLCAALGTRQAIGQKLQEQGFSFPALVHLDAIVGRGCEVEDGAQVMAGAVVQADSRIGAFAVVNSRASVDHDCRIAPGVHIAPGASLGGNVQVGVDAFVGIGASVVHGVNIGAGALVGAGAAAVNDVQDGTCVVGVPAKEMK